MPISLVDRYQKKFGIKTQLRGYQLRAANLGVELPGYALLLAPRLGKTRVDVAVAGYRFLNDDLIRWVIVCPVIAMSVWKAEIENSLAVPHEVHILEGKINERRLMLKNWEDTPGVLSIVILNFEATWRVKKFLYKFNPGKVTVDESHRIKDHASAQSKAIYHLGKRAEFRCIMTGTFMAKVTDCFSQYRFLDSSVFGTKWKCHHKSPDKTPGFLETYADKWGYGGHKPETFKSLDDLQQRIQSRAFILDRAGAGGFPKEQVQTFSFKLTNPAAKHYKEMENELRTMVEGNRVSAEIVLTQILRLQQITGGFLPVLKPDEDQATNIPLGRDRLVALEELLDQYPGQEPIVIFAKFRYEISAILAVLKKMRRSSNFIVGGMKGGRDQAIADFQSGRFDTCVVQVRAGGISVDLSRADNAIFYSASHYMEYEQAKARIIARTGGKKSFIRLAAEDTVDIGILEALDTGASTVEKILGKPIYK